MWKLNRGICYVTLCVDRSVNNTVYTCPEVHYGAECIINEVTFIEWTVTWVYVLIRKVKYAIYQNQPPNSYLCKGVSYSYFNVFGILIFFLLYVLPLHPYIPKIKNSDRGSTLISDILMQIVISPFSLEILRKLPSFVFFTTKSR